MDIYDDQVKLKFRYDYMDYEFSVKREYMKDYHTDRDVYGVKGVDGVERKKVAKFTIVEIKNKDSSPVNWYMAISGGLGSKLESSELLKKAKNIDIALRDFLFEKGKEKLKLKLLTDPNIEKLNGQWYVLDTDNCKNVSLP